MRILLTRTDRIGDLVLSTPAIATVRASFPDAHITMLVSSYNRVVMERSRDVDELMSLEGKVPRGFDLAIALAPRTADLRIVGASRAKQRVGYTYVRRWFTRLTAPLFVDTLMISEADPALCERDPTLRVRHEVDQLLDLVALAGAKTRVSALRLPVRDEDRAAAAALPENPIVFHLGNRWFRQGSSFASTQRLLEDLAGIGRNLVVTTPRESLSQAAALRLPAGCSVLGYLPFFTWAAVFERASCVVTVDTAATHVASAVRRPTVVAFEHRYFRLSSQEWAPYGVPHVLVRKPASEDPHSLAAFRNEIVEGVKTLLHA
jgi:ADP-heptose:LPS heptosyltransferase